MANSNAKRLECANLYRENLRKLSAEFLGHCNDLVDINRNLHPITNREKLFEICARYALEEGTFAEKWNHNVCELEKHSNGRFNAKLPHTWNQLGEKARYIMTARDCIIDMKAIEVMADEEERRCWTEEECIELWNAKFRDVYDGIRLKFSETLALLITEQENIYGIQKRITKGSNRRIV